MENMLTLVQTSNDVETGDTPLNILTETGTETGT